VQASAAAHDTALKKPSATGGVRWIDQRKPSQRSTKGSVVTAGLARANPTAVHAVLELQDTPVSSVSDDASPFRVDSRRHREPLHSSASVTARPAGARARRASTIPTAMQRRAEGHETACSEPPGRLSVWVRHALALAPDAVPRHIATANDAPTSARNPRAISPMLMSRVPFGAIGSTKSGRTESYRWRQPQAKRRSPGNRAVAADRARSGAPPRSRVTASPSLDKDWLRVRWGPTGACDH
jgi:hypothetical protein